MASFLDKAASTFNEAKESVTATAESVGASLTEAQKTVAASAETVTTSLTDAGENAAASAETVKRSLTDAGETVAASTETVKSEAAAAPEKVSNVSTQVCFFVTLTSFYVYVVRKAKTYCNMTVLCLQAREVVDNVLSKGFEGINTLLHGFEEKKTDISSKIVDVATKAVAGASSSTTVESRDVPISTDNQVTDLKQNSLSSRN